MLNIGMLEVDNIMGAVKELTANQKEKELEFAK